MVTYILIATALSFIITYTICQTIIKGINRHMDKRFDALRNDMATIDLFVREIKKYLH